MATKRPLPPFGHYKPMPDWIIDKCPAIVSPPAFMMLCVIWQNCRLTDGYSEMRPCRFAIRDFMRKTGCSSHVVRKALKDLEAELLILIYPSNKRRTAQSYAVVPYNADSFAKRKTMDVVSVCEQMIHSSVSPHRTLKPPECIPTSHTILIYKPYSKRWSGKSPEEISQAMHDLALRKNLKAATRVS